jgi:hypothetical protein
VARDFVSLDNPQFHVSTITEQKDKNNESRAVVESNNMMLGLTDELKKQYQTIAGSDEVAKEQIDWYKELDDFDKKLVTSYAAKIAQGSTMIPTQLRKHLPGLRNAYTKTTSVQKTDGEISDGEISKVLETFQAGTVSFHGKGNRTTHTKGNLDQLDTFLPPGKAVNINPLNSPELLPGIPNFTNPIDRDAPELIREAQKQRNKGSISLTPFNALRRTTYNNNSGFNKALYEIGTKLESKDFNTLAIAMFLRADDGRLEQEAKEQLAALKSSKPELALALSHAMEAKNIILHRRGIGSMSDPQNSNLELTAHMSITAFQCTQGTLSKEIPNLDVEFILSHCASGKDRGGLLATKATHDAVTDALGLDATNPAHKEIIERNLRTQIDAGHTQVLASINGGTPGSHGIKHDTLAACPKGSQYKNLHEKTAESNKFKTPPSRWKQVFQKIKKSKVAKALAAPFVIAAAAVVAAATLVASPYIAAQAYIQRKNVNPSVKRSSEKFFDLSSNPYQNRSQANQRQEPSVEHESVVHTTEQNRPKPAPIMPEHEVEVRETNTTNIGPGTTPKGNKSKGQKKSQQQGNTIL